MIRASSHGQRPCSPADASARSGQVVRPIDAIRRSAVVDGDAATELERYKLSLRRFAPSDDKPSWLPWRCRSHCPTCGQLVDAAFEHEPADEAVYLAWSCPQCGRRRERQHDAICTTARPAPPGQPARTYGGRAIRPVSGRLPRTVETLCPECGCVILGRYFARDGAVLMEKTCPDHGYFRDTITTDERLYRKAAAAVFPDERGVRAPQVTGGRRCPTDCGLCDGHLSCSCLAQIDLTNRCNLACPVCFASANAPGETAQPTLAMVREMLAALRRQRPYPATAIQFTGGEPTLHPDFHRIVRLAREMGFSHIQTATNGLKLADPDFAERCAEAGLHTLYLQFDGTDDAVYRQTRGRPLLEHKLRCIEQCRRLGMKVVLVPTLIKGVNDHQVGPIFRFAVEHIDAVSAISYQPVSFTGRISQADLERQRYTLGELARDIAAASGADLERDFWPLGMIAPLGRIMECLDGKSKIRPSCHSDCAIGTYFFVTPDKQAIPIPQLFDMYRLMADFNDQAGRIQARRRSGDEIVRANPRELARIVWSFVRRYNWRAVFKTDIKPWTFIRALQGLTNKAKGRGSAERHSYKTLMAAGMHFMDRHNYDVDRARRCVILYSTPDGIYPFCTINGGPTYRPYVERVCAAAAGKSPGPSAESAGPDASASALAGLQGASHGD